MAKQDNSNVLVVTSDSRMLTVFDQLGLYPPGCSVTEKATPEQAQGKNIIGRVPYFVGCEAEDIISVITTFPKEPDSNGVYRDKRVEDDELLNYVSPPSRFKIHPLSDDTHTLAETDASVLIVHDHAEGIRNYLIGAGIIDDETTEIKCSLLRDVTAGEAEDKHVFGVNLPYHITACAVHYTELHMKKRFPRNARVNDEDIYYAMGRRMRSYTVENLGPVKV